MSDLHQFDTVIAIFNPKRTDDMRSGSERFIGIQSKWEAQTYIESGPYAGQWAMVPVPDVFTWPTRPPFAWVPESDLEIIGEPIPWEATPDEIQAVIDEVERPQ